MESKIILTLIIILLGAILVTKLETPNQPNIVSISTVTASVPNDSKYQNELVIYTYDGITSEWGLGPKIFPKFEKECNCKVLTVAKGDVGAFISRMIFEKNNPVADVALGTDNTFRERAEVEDLFEPYPSSELQNIGANLYDGDSRFIPFDWGYLAFVYDSEKIKPPQNLEELTLPKYYKKIIIEDARTSSPGKVFLHWVASEYGNNTEDYLKRLRPNLLTIAPGWSEAYNLFLQGEAPIVLSYSTSPAYHILNENVTKYKAAIFPKMFRQIEYVGVVKNAKNKELARKFVDFLLSKKAQVEIPAGNFMYPSITGVKLPDAFKSEMLPEESYVEINEGDKWIRIWEKIFSD
jgi:thiamine transport system substrate-binding protein